MDAREYFLRIRNDRYTIKAFKKEIDELEELAKTAGSGALDYSKDKIQNSSSNTPAFVLAIEKLYDTIEKHSKELSECEARRERGIAQLRKLNDGIKFEVLYMKFFEDMSLERIARSTGYTLGTVTYHYMKGLEEFDKKRLWLDE